MKIKKKTAALLFACAWAVIALTASVAFRATSARALSQDDVITIIASSNHNVQGGEDGEFTWGTFYCGIKLLNEAKWIGDDGITNGTVSISSGSDDYHVSIGNVDDTDALNDRTHEHDFTASNLGGGASWESTDHGHYAKCADCNFKLEVAHRLSTDGNCQDCNASALNYYSFTLPDSYTPIEWDPSSGATVNISFTAQICWGYVLTLKLSCSGTLSAGGDASIPYSISSVDSGGTGTATTPSNANLTEEPIWQLSASEVLNGDEMRTDLSGTITVTLSGANDTDIPPYAGTFTDTLTFSVTLEQETV